MERKKNRVFYMIILVLCYHLGLHLSVFSSLHKIESQEIAKTKAILNDAHEKFDSLLARFGLFYATRFMRKELKCQYAF
jgi:hypothetical protein